MKQKNENPTYEVWRKTRRTWEINPITRVVQNKKKKKNKHEKRDIEREMD